MKAIYSILIGAFLGIGSIFLHLVLPPFGFIFAIISSMVGIWAIGRTWGKRYLKVIAGCAWVIIVIRGGTPGLSNEILIQGDALGSALINIGFIAIFAAVAIAA
jgi:hypothetical protein